MHTGKIKFYNEVKGYGFIVPNDGSADVFFHAKALRGVKIDPKKAKNAAVDYELAEAKEPGKLQAKKVVICP